VLSIIKAYLDIETTCALPIVMKPIIILLITSQIGKRLFVFIKNTKEYWYILLAFSKYRCCHLRLKVSKDNKI